MVRRIHAAFALMALFLLTVVGCESLRPSVRSSRTETLGSRQPAIGATAVESDPSRIQAVDADPKNPRSFFKNNRRSGTWSSEAREIESHLGVGP